MPLKGQYPGTIITNRVKKRGETHPSTRSSRSPGRLSGTASSTSHAQPCLTKTLMDTVMSCTTGNYVTLATILIVVFLSFLLPNISQKVRVCSEVKEMKKMLEVLAKEVDRAEVACVTAANDVCVLHTTVHDQNTETPEKVRTLRELSAYSTSSNLHQTLSEPVRVSDKKVGFLRRIFFPSRYPSTKEIPLMSYVYTNSFDTKKKMNSTSRSNHVLQSNA